jgi:hypothetical protein
MDQRASKVLKKFESLAAISDWLLLDAGYGLDGPLGNVCAC